MRSLFLGKGLRKGKKGGQAITQIAVYTKDTINHSFMSQCEGIIQAERFEDILIGKEPPSIKRSPNS